MPTYKIKAPDGNTYRIEGPEGASDEDIRAEVLKQHPAAAGDVPKAAAKEPPPIIGGVDPTEGMSTLGKLGVGFQSGVEDKVLGARQFLASTLGIGDEAALKAQAEEKARLDKPLLASGAGTTGNIAGNMITDLLAMAAGGAALKGGGMALKAGAGLLPRAVAGATTAAAGGAESGLTTPSATYDPTTQAAEGAAWGVGGDVLGRGVGRVLRPVQSKVGQAVSEHIQGIKDALPNAKLLAANLTDSAPVQALTNALAQIPGFGGGVNAARRDIAEGVTEKITGAAGLPMKEVAPSTAARLEAELKSGFERFSAPTMPRVNLQHVPAQLQDTLQSLDITGKISGKRGPSRTVGAASEGSIATPAGPPTTYHLPSGMKYNVPGTPAIPEKITAKQALDLRSAASERAFSAKDPFERQAYTAVRDALENAISATHSPSEAAAFDALRKRWGVWESIKTAGAGGKGGTIRPEDFAKTLSDARQLAPQTQLEKLVVGAGERAPSPSLSENRSLMVRALMGGAIPATGAVLGGLSSGDLTGAGTGAVGSLALAHLLLGTPGGGRYLTGQNRSALGQMAQSPEMKRWLERMLISGANQAGQ
jgi:hypothetical protein